MARRRRRRGGSRRRSVRGTYSSLAGLAGRSDPFDPASYESKVPWVWLGLGAAGLFVLMDRAPANKGVSGLGFNFGRAIRAALPGAIANRGGSMPAQAAAAAALGKVRPAPRGVFGRYFR